MLSVRVLLAICAACALCLIVVMHSAKALMLRGKVQETTDKLHQETTGRTGHAAANTAAALESAPPTSPPTSPPTPLFVPDTTQGNCTIIRHTQEERVCVRQQDESKQQEDDGDLRPQHIAVVVFTTAK